MANIFTEYGNKINSKETFETLKDIVSQYGGTFTDAVKSASQKALVQAERNKAWAEEYSASISDWLVANDYTLSTTTSKPGGGASSIAAGSLLTVVMMLVTLIC